MKRFVKRYVNIVVIIAIFVALSIGVWLLGDENTADNEFHRQLKIVNNQNRHLENIKCFINNEKNLTCVKQLNKYFIPFDFISKKFDLQSNEEEHGYFKFKFTNSKIFSPQRNYDPKREYLWFNQVNVESRDKVLYMSLTHGVPISCQWNKSGHIYPLQVAQYGLSHFSKWITRNNSNDESNYNGFYFGETDAFIYNENKNLWLKNLKNGFEFNFPDRAIYKTNYTRDIRYISAEISTKASFELMIDLTIRENFEQDQSHQSKIGRVIYTFDSSNNSNYSSESIRTDQRGNSFTIQFKLKHNFRHLQKIIRNICIDACKALKLVTCEKCLKTPTSNSKNYQFYKVYQIGLKGNGRFQNGFFSEQIPEIELATQAANYLIFNQNAATGGWMINVTRKFDKKAKITINPGWYSGMAQGQAISLLCRLYKTTKKGIYLDSASNALNLFQVDVKFGGVSTRFLNEPFVWFEEYPTKPISLYVLNGFVYSIFGIGDYLVSCQNETDTNRSVSFQIARKLFTTSLKSLAKLVSFYDTGSRTLYDLRHLSDPEIYPNIARWDYHTLHVSQLYYLVSFIQKLDRNLFENYEELLEYSRVLKTIAFRWKNYINGIWNQESQIKPQKI